MIMRPLRTIVRPAWPHPYHTLLTPPPRCNLATHAPCHHARPKKPMHGSSFCPPPNEGATDLLARHAVHAAYRASLHGRLISRTHAAQSCESPRYSPLGCGLLARRAPQRIRRFTLDRRRSHRRLRHRPHRHPHRRRHRRSSRRRHPSQVRALQRPSLRTSDRRSSTLLP